MNINRSNDEFMENKEESLHLLRKLKLNSSQREFADELGLSLGKVNYCLNELKKGFD